MDVVNPSNMKINQTNYNIIKGFMCEMVHEATQMNNVVSVFLCKVLEQREIIKTC